MHHRTLVAAALGLAFSTGCALAQSYNAPAGIPADTAPGGLVGRSAYPVLQDASPDPRVVARDSARGDLSTGSIDRRSGDRARPSR